MSIDGCHIQTESGHEEEKGYLECERKALHDEAEQPFVESTRLF